MGSVAAAVGSGDAITTLSQKHGMSTLREGHGALSEQLSVAIRKQEGLVQSKIAPVTDLKGPARLPFLFNSFLL